jgi:putative transposase
MKNHSEKFPIEKMAKILKVSRAGYYEFLKKIPSQRALENEKLIEKIRAAHKKGRGTYGSPRVHRELIKAGETCSRKRVARLMHKENIQAKMRKKWKVRKCLKITRTSFDKSWCNRIVPFRMKIVTFYIQSRHLFI